MLARTPPLALGVALIMFSNNLCDLERDAAAGRRTFPLMLGARRAAKLYRALLALWPASQAALLLALDGRGPPRSSPPRLSRPRRLWSGSSPPRPARIPARR